jgi:beta-N-acetylhexosaminidase
MMSSDLHKLCARLICVGFDGLTVPREMDDLLRDGVGGAVLFARNVDSPQQVADLNADLKRRSRVPLMTCVDHEGGRVRRLRAGFSSIPSMRELGRACMDVVKRSASPQPETRTPKPSATDRGLWLAKAIGTILGQEVRAVGFDVDFAPVLDVDTNPKNPVIADRSLGPDPQLVARLGVELIRAIQAEGVAACGKHFPGHGDTWLDSHHELPKLEHDRARLDAVELVPFAAAARAGAASMMTSHIVFPKLDPTYPATLSPLILHKLLREEFQYDGVVFTDDMEMKAIADHFGFEDAVIRTVEAGADVVTICHSHTLQRRAIEALVKAVESGRLPRERVEQSVGRISRLCAKFVRGPERNDLSVLDTPEHRSTVDRIARINEAIHAGPDPTESWR